MCAELTWTLPTVLMIDNFNV